MALHLPTGPFLTELIIGYMTLFSIINPFGVAFVFLSMTRRASEAERTAIARRIGVYSFVILLVSLFVGSQILNIFGISVPALRIAGGLVVALSGWGMLQAPDEVETPTEVVAHPAALADKAFFPLTMPLTTGPGSIATAIALGANRTGGLREIFASSLASLVVAALVAVTVTFAYAHASALSRWAGHDGTRVIIRLSAFLLMCVGVEIILTGVSDFLPPLVARGVHLSQD